MTKAWDSTELSECLVAKLNYTLATGLPHCMLALEHWSHPRHQAYMCPGYMLALSACRYGNTVTQPAASDLVVKVPGSQRNHGFCIFDTPDETIVQYSVQEAGENMRLAVMCVTKRLQP